MTRIPFLRSLLLLAAGLHGSACRSSHAHHGAHHFENAETWVPRFEDPARDEWQKPEQVLEALALGTPVAAIETGGTREILAGESGLLAADAAGLADAVGRLVREPTLRRRVQEAARVRAEAFRNASFTARIVASGVGDSR